MKYRICLLIGLLFTGVQTALAVPTESEIRSILQNRIDTEKRGVGIVVGLIDKNGRTIISHGTFTKDGDRPVDENTVFEIGSITKVFTATLLVDMVSRGELDLDDPISKHVPESVKVPTRIGENITLKHQPFQGGSEIARQDPSEYGTRPAISEPQSSNRNCSVLS